MSPETQDRWPGSPLVRAWQCHSCYQISPFMAAHTKHSPIPFNQCVNPSCSMNRCHNCFDLNAWLEVIQFQDCSSVPENVVSYLNYRNALDLPPTNVPNPPARGPPQGRLPTRASSPPFPASRWAPSTPAGYPSGLQESVYTNPRLSYLASQQTPSIFSTGLRPAPQSLGETNDLVEMPNRRLRPAGMERAAGTLRLRQNYTDQLAQIPSTGIVPPDPSSLEVAGRSEELYDRYVAWRMLQEDETQAEIQEDESEESEEE